MVNATTIVHVADALEECEKNGIHFEWRGGAYHKVKSTEKKGDE